MATSAEVRLEFRTTAIPGAAPVPVLRPVIREDGTEGWVPVGTARVVGHALVLNLEARTVEVATVAPPKKPVTAPVEPKPGMAEDLQYIAQRARKTLADPGKAKWHEEEREILRQAESELARLGVKLE